jgi:BlaI family transcriptional regulator, penicillinase repressor
MDATLSELQLELMQVLWREGKATTAEVAQALRPARDLAHTTVATLLSRLEKRGLVASHRVARILVYRPLVAQAVVKRAMTGGLLDRLYAGRPSQLLSHLLDERRFDESELAELRRLLKKHRE